MRDLVCSCMSVKRAFTRRHVAYCGTVEVNGSCLLSDSVSGDDSCSLTRAIKALVESFAAALLEAPALGGIITVFSNSSSSAWTLSSGVSVSDPRSKSTGGLGGMTLATLGSLGGMGAEPNGFDGAAAGLESAGAAESEAGGMGADPNGAVAGAASGAGVESKVGIGADPNGAAGGVPEPGAEPDIGIGADPSDETRAAGRGVSGFASSAGGTGADAKGEGLSKTPDPEADLVSAGASVFSADGAGADAKGDGLSKTPDPEADLVSAGAFVCSADGVGADAKGDGLSKTAASAAGAGVTSRGSEAGGAVSAAGAGAGVGAGAGATGDGLLLTAASVAAGLTSFTGSVASFSFTGGSVVSCFATTSFSFTGGLGVSCLEAVSLGAAAGSGFLASAAASGFAAAGVWSLAGSKRIVSRAALSFSRGSIASPTPTSNFGAENWLR